jgi:hypothetical protein
VKISRPITYDLYPFQPTCFGYEYLTAIEAFDQETGGPDLETLRGSLSDMLNMKLTSQLTDIMEACSVEQQEDSKVVGESYQHKSINS